MSEAWKILGIAIARTARFVVPLLAAAAAWAWGAEIPWETMFGLVQIEGVAEGFASAILAVLVLALIPLAWVWWRDWNILRTFIGKVQAAPNEPYGFADHRRDLDADILGMSGKRFDRVKHAWREFHKSVFTEKDATEKILAYNTVPPENFFTPEKLGMNFSFFRALSGYFVGVGLLLTFFGLAAALFYANKSIADGGGEVSKTQDALGLLLDAATLKFMTSITGLFSSIVLSASALIASRHMSRLCADICRELELRVEFAAQERLAMMQFQELRGQAAALKNFSTDLAVSIAKRGVLAALNESGLPGLTKTLGEVSGDGETLTGKVDNVKNKLDALAGEIAREIEDPVKSGVASGMKEIQGEVARLAEKVVEDGKKGVQGITKDISDKIEASTQTIKTAAGALVDAAGDLRQIASNLDGQASAAKESKAQMAALQEAMNGLSDVMGGQREKFQELANKAQEAAKAIESAADRHARTIKEASDSVSTSVSGAEAQMSALQEAVNGLGGVLGGQREKFQELANKTQEAAKALGLAADRHKESVKPIAAAATRVREALGEIRKIHEKIAASNTELRQFWEQHDGRFAGVDERLGAVVEQIVKSNDEYRESVKKFAEELAEKLANALAQFNSAIDALSEAAGNLRDGGMDKR